MHNSVIKLKTIDLYSLKGWILCYLNDLSKEIKFKMRANGRWKQK